MRRAIRSILLVTIGFGIAGCAKQIPAKLEVRDVSSGRTYTTYKPWGKITKGVGYDFTDAETGKRVTLTNYELSTIEGPKKVSPGSAEAKMYDAQKAQGGVK